VIFSTSDGQFGFVLTKVAGQNMFEFQLVIEGNLIGDREPCIAGSAMIVLGELRHLDDQRLGLLFSDRDALVAVLDSDEDLHDVVALSIAESLDGWWLRGYVYDGNVVLLARERRQGRVMGELLVSIVAMAEYGSVHGAASDYWVHTRDSV
jgi:hypothetical protein